MGYLPRSTSLKLVAWPFTMIDYGGSNQVISSLHSVQFSFMHPLFALDTLIFPFSSLPTSPTKFHFLFWQLRWSGGPSLPILYQSFLLKGCSNGMQILNIFYLSFTFNLSSSFFMSIKIRPVAKIGQLSKIRMS